MSSYELEGIGDNLQEVIERLSNSTRPPTVRGLLQLMDAAGERDKQIDEELAEILKDGSDGQT